MATNDNDFLGQAIEQIGTEGVTDTAGAPPSSSSLLDDVIVDVGNEQRARNYVGALQSFQADPEKYQEFRDLGETFGVPVDFVGRNYDRLSREFKVRDIGKLLDKEPVLGRWYTEGDNPNAIKVDELRHLSGLSWLGKSAWDSFGEGRSNVNLANLRYRQLMGLATDDEIGQADALAGSMQPRTYAADSWMQRGWVGAAGQLPIMAEQIAAGFVGGLQGAAAGMSAAAIAGQMGPQVAAPEEMFTVPAAGYTGYRIGASAGIFQASFRLESGLAFDEFLSYRDESGNPLDPDVARTAAIVVGGLNAGLELIGMQALARVVPGLDQLTGAIGADAVKMALARPTVQQAFKDFGVNILRSATTETLTEVGQEAISMFAGILSREYANTEGADFPAVTGEDMADRLGGALQQTLETMTILGPVLSGTRLGHDLNRARSASQHQAALDAIIDHANSDELAKRLPDKAAEAVRRITENGPVQSVFIDPTAFQTYFQDAADLSRFTAEIGLADEFNEAARTGREMEIPIEVYYTAIAPTEFGQASRQYVKFSADDMTTVEADAFNEAWAEAQASLSQEYQEREQGEMAALEATEVIHQDVKQRAMDAGIVPDQAEQYARLYSTFFRVMGERTLQDAGELYSRYGFDIKRALPGMQQYQEADGTSVALELMRRGRIEPLRKRVEKSRGQSLVARIQSRGGIIDTGGELAAMNANAVIRPYEGTGSGNLAGMGDFNQFSADDTVRQLWEEGYFPEFDARPDPNALYDAIAAELAGEARYSVQQDQSQTPENIRAAELVAFADALDALGLDPTVMDEAEIREALERIASEDPETGALFQAAAAAAATDTPEFKAWFGDSKVVDEDGKPLVVYHGTNQPLEQFSMSRGGMATGANAGATKAFFFTDNRAVADQYASNAGERVVSNIEAFEKEQARLQKEVERLERAAQRTGNWDAYEAAMAAWEDLEIGATREDASVGANVVETYLSLQNPMEIDMGGSRLTAAQDMEAFIDQAKAAGHDGLIVRNLEDSPKMGIVSTHYVAFEPTQIKSINNRGTFDASDPRIMFQQEGQEVAGPETTKRGSIQFGDGRTIINLFDAANLSTFLHESGHFFLEVFRDLSTVENAPPELLQDWNTTREYLGIGEAGTIPTEAHEKFARTFEAYLFEGKAPSNEVAGIMARFRSWLAFVYRSIAQLDVPINDDIRRVMDRMIATDDEISAASFSPEFRPAFKSAADAGMTETQWAKYLETAGRAVEETRRNLTARMLQDVSREATTEWREARRLIRNAVTAEYERLPVYRVTTYLRTGRGDGMQGVDRMYLDRAAIDQVMGEGAALKMPRGTYRIKGGVHPDVLAEMFGFDSGHAMLTQMMSVPSLGRAIAEETNRRMRERFGDLMGDAVARSREVSAAIANDATGDLLAAEMEVLMRKGLVTSKIRKEDARRVARETIRAKPVREAVRAKLYMNADAKAATQAEQAILAGRWVDAVAAKQRQLLNHYMAMEAVEVEREVRKAVEYLNRFTGRKRPKNVDPEYLDQIEKVLERFDMRRSTTLKQQQRRESLASWIAQQEAMGAIVAIPDVIRDDAFRKSYKEMTVDDLTAVRDAVQSIEHLGRLKSKLIANKKQRDFEAVRDEMVAAIAVSQERRKKPKTRNPTLIDRSLSFMRSLEATMLKLEQVFNWMDDGDINGPFRRYVWQPIADAEFRENEMREKFAGKAIRIFEGLDKKRLTERLTIPGLDRTFLRSEIMAVALNMGSESNLDKMLRGEGWDKNPAILDRIVAHLNDAEWQAVQGIWDVIEELWPEVEGVQRRLTGVAPPRVERRKFTSPTGREMSGGYYPMIYDPKQVDIGTDEGLAVIRSQAVTDMRIADNDRVQFENTYLRPETRHGFTKERAQKFAMPILFDLDGFGRHLIEVIHDVTHREALIDANKLLTNPIIRGEIESRYGRELYTQMVPWLQSLAHDPYKRDGLAPADTFMRHVRTRATIMAMGFRVSTILTQLAGYSSSLEMVSARQLAGAMKDFIAAPLATWDMVQSLSGEMRSRTQTLDRDVRERVRELTGKTDFISRAQKFAFYGIGYMDRVVVAPTWLAAYREHLAKDPADQDGAIAAGDRAVRLTQGSGGPKDLSAVQRNNELTKLLTMFYSYFSAYYNRQRTWGREAKKAIQSGEVREFPQLLARQVFMTIGPAIVAELLVGRGPDAEDDESWTGWAAKKIAFYPVMAVPIVRDVAGFFESGGRFDYSFTPAERTVTEAVIRPIQVIGDIWDGDADPRLVTKALINSAGYWFALPVGQLATTVDNVWKGIENDDFQLRDIVLTRPANR